MNGAAVRRRLVRILVVIGVLLVPGLKLGWYYVASHAADGISFTWGPDCPEVQVTEGDGPSLLVASPGWSCRIDVTVTNNNYFAVRMIAIQGGPGGGLGGEMLALPWPEAEAGRPGTGLEPASSPDHEAQWLARTVIPRGESRTFSIHLGWRPAGCNRVDEVVLQGWPEVSFDALGMTHYLVSEQELRIRTYDDGRGNVACPT